MIFPLSTLKNPLSESLFLSFTEFSLGVLGRHSVIWIRVVDPADEFAFVGIVWDDRGNSCDVGFGSGLGVESEICFPVCGVRAVALEAVFS
jgi:hypothetical protein